MPKEACPIKYDWFYSSEAEKTKFNWFCLEVALEYYDHISDSPLLSAFRKHHSNLEIARFCTYYAKRMKDSIMERLAGKTESTIIYEEYFEEYYPDNSKRHNQLLMQVAAQAWESHLRFCETCPQRCISEKDEPSPFFDEYRE